MLERDRSLYGEEEQVVVCDVAGESFAIAIQQVNTIVPVPEITAVPGAPGDVVGVINLRGSILPVIDLRMKFGVEVRPADKDTRIVVVEAGCHTAGLIVDAVIETVRLSLTDIEPPPSTVQGCGTAYLRGVGKYEDRLLLIVDLDRLLTVEELTSGQLAA